MCIPPPSRTVSPFVKLCRYGFLLLGMGYGAANHARFEAKESKLRAVRVKQKAARDAKLAEEKKRLAKLEAEAIDILSGVKRPDVKKK